MADTPLRSERALCLLVALHDVGRSGGNMRQMRARHVQHKASPHAKVDVDVYLNYDCFSPPLTISCCLVRCVLLSATGTYQRTRVG